MGFDSPSVRIRFDGKVFVPVEPVDLPVGTMFEARPEPVRKARNPQFGTAKGQGRIADDFDEIPERFEEYIGLLALLDTHAFLWAALEPEKLSRNAKEAIAAFGNIVIPSTAS